MSIVKVSLASMKSRRLSTVFTVTSIAISVCLILGVNRIKDGIRTSFESTISGTDLLVGPRGGDLSLLMMAVFNLGNPTNLLSHSTYDYLKSHEQVAWTVPLSIGDSHRGYRVIGTSEDYARFVKFADNQSHTLSAGTWFKDDGSFSAVVGAEVAQTLGYKLGSKIVLQHGLDEHSIHAHDDQPFEVVGILKASGTPTDRCILVSLDGIAHIHEGWEDGVPPEPEELFDAVPETATKEKNEEHDHGHEHDHAHDHEHDHDEHEHGVSAVLLGLKSRGQVLQFGRHLNEYENEALSAVIPGIALGQLWQIADVGERALIALGALVIMSAILGMLASVLSSLNERRREIAILRALGATPGQVMASLMLEGVFLGGLGFLLGFILVNGIFFGLKAFHGFGLGIYLSNGICWGWYEFLVFSCVMLASLAAGFVFALRAYGQSLADGLTIKY